MTFNRRDCLRSALALGAAALPCSARAAAEWTVLQPAPLSGVNGGVGWHLRLGALLAFQAANASGGVHGRPLRLWTLDEEAGRVAAQVREAAGQTPVLALLGLNGRRAVAELAAANLPAALGVAVLGVKSGSVQGAGFAAPWLFPTRGSYQQELERVFRQASTIFVRRVALVTTDDDDGSEIIAAARSLAPRHGIDLAIAPRHPADTALVTDAVASVLASPPEAVVLATNTAAVAYFAKLYREARGRAQLIALSSAEATQLASVVGPEAARGMIISQVVPHPHDPRVPLMRELLEARSRFAPDAPEPTLTMAEGYVAARVLVEALQRCGPAATGPALAATLAARRSPIDLDGLRVGLQRDGAHYGSLSILGRDGQVVF